MIHAHMGQKTLTTITVMVQKSQVPGFIIILGDLSLNT